MSSPEEKSPQDLPKGCVIGCLYVPLSYVLNWLVLHYIYIPMNKAGWIGVADSWRGNESAFMWLLSPITLPFELLFILIGAFLKAFQSFAP